MVDIKDLNKIIELNYYLLLLLFNIIFIIIRFLYIFIINKNDYFYQFFIRYKNKNNIILFL